MDLPIYSKAVNKLVLGLPETRSIGGIPTWPQTLSALTSLPRLCMDIRICSPLYDASSFRDASRGSAPQKRLGLRRLSEDLDQPVRDRLILAVFQLPNRETEGVRIAV